MRAWEREKLVLQNSMPTVFEEENAKVWTKSAADPEQFQDAQQIRHWRKVAPGSKAPESVMTAAIQATENKGRIVEETDELLDSGFEALDKGTLVALHKISYRILEACRNAKKDESSPYWDQTFYDTFEAYERSVSFPPRNPKAMDSGMEQKQYAGWLAQIIGGAYGTCIEGYTSANIKKAYGVVDRYIRRPHTYNDDITFELALLCAYDEFGRDTTSKNIADEWTARIPTGFSAEEVALTNLKAGIVPPESGRFNNPFNEWIGAQMRGAVCGQIYPGDLREAARSAWMDAEISHARNGILGEVFNAVLTSMAFCRSDIRGMIEDAVGLIPADSEYGKVVRFALDQCRNSMDYETAWAACEQRYDHYNWIHAYPNACAEIVALWFGDLDFTKTLTICGMCGQDVDCNAAQIMTVVAIITGADSIPEYWKEPFGDELNTYVRGMKSMTISGLASWTAAIARKLAGG